MAAGVLGANPRSLSVDRPVDTSRLGGTVLVMTAPSPVGDSSNNLERFEQIASDRRSSLKVDPDIAIDDELLDRLITVAATAPNHKRTFPWRFRVITGDGRAQLGNAFALDLETAGEADAKIEKARTKYQRAPVIVAVAAMAGVDETMTAENRDAVSAAIQTLLLGATAAGLASYWSTGGAMNSTGVKEFCQFNATDTMVGLIYLGWPTGDPPALERPAPESIRIGRSTTTP
jgi:nitroreductase